MDQEDADYAFDGVDFEGLASLLASSGFNNHTGEFGASGFTPRATDDMNLHSSMLDDITEEDLLRMELGDFPSPPTGLQALDSPSAVEAAINRGPAVAHEAAVVPAVAGPSPARTPSKRKRATLPTVAEATPPLPPSRSPQLPLDVYTSGIGRGGSPSLRGMTTRRVTPTASPAAAAAAYRSPVLSPLAPHSASGIRISTPVSASAPPPLSLPRSNSSRPRSAASTPGTPYSGSATPTGSSCRRPEFDDLTNCALCRSGYKNGDKWRNVRRVHIHWYLLMESGSLCNPDTKAPIMLLSEWQDKEPYKVWAVDKAQRVSSHFKVFTHEQLAHAFSSKSTAMVVHKHCLHAFNFVVKARYDDLVRMTGYTPGPHPDDFGTIYSKKDMDEKLMFDPDVPEPLYVTNKRALSRKYHRDGRVKRVRHRTSTGSKGSKGSSLSKDSSSMYTKSTHSTRTSAAARGLPPRRPLSALSSPAVEGPPRGLMFDQEPSASRAATVAAAAVEAVAPSPRPRGSPASKRAAAAAASAMATNPVFLGPFGSVDGLEMTAGAPMEDGFSGTGLSAAGAPRSQLDDFLVPALIPGFKDRGWSDDMVQRAGQYTGVEPDDAYDGAFASGVDASAGAALPGSGSHFMASLGTAAVPVTVAEADEDQDDDDDDDDAEDDDEYLPGTKFAPYNFSDNIALSVATL